MKKLMNWMLAAILICGTSIAVTACGGDDDNKGSETVPNTYEVTLTAVLHQCTAEFFYLDVEYTDAAGKKNTVSVKAGDQSETMNEEANKIFHDRLNEIAAIVEDGTPEQKADFEKYIVKNIKITVPEGKKFSFAGTVKARRDYTTTSQEVNIITPVVFSTCKKVSGNSYDRAISGYSGTIKISAFIGVQIAEEGAIEELFSDLDGKNAGKAEITL